MSQERGPVLQKNCYRLVRARFILEEGEKQARRVQKDDSDITSVEFQDHSLDP